MRSTSNRQHRVLSTDRTRLHEVIYRVPSTVILRILIQILIQIVVAVVVVVDISNSERHNATRFTRPIRPHIRRKVGRLSHSCRGFLRHRGLEMRFLLHASWVQQYIATKLLLQSLQSRQILRKSSHSINPYRLRNPVRKRSSKRFEVPQAFKGANSEGEDATKEKLHGGKCHGFAVLGNPTLTRSALVRWLREQVIPASWGNGAASARQTPNTTTSIRDLYTSSRTPGAAHSRLWPCCLQSWQHSNNDPSEKFLQNTSPPTSVTSRPHEQR